MKEVIRVAELSSSLGHDRKAGSEGESPSMCNKASDLHALSS